MHRERCKIIYMRWKNMKNMKTRIAAAACAAITAVCGMQAISASAYQNYFVHTVNSQDYCENAYNMGQAIKGWSRFGGINANSTWTGSATCGPICKKNFGKVSYSGNNNGTVLTKSQGLSMYLAQSFFGTTVFMEHITGSNTVYKPGDQVRIGSSTRNAAQKTIFITYVSGNTFDTYSINHSTNKIECCKYRKIAGSYRFQRLNANGTVAEDNIYTDFLIRPIKQGDVNGDGIFSDDDQTWLNDHIGAMSNYPKDANAVMNPSTKATELFIRAAFGDKQTWTIPYSAYYTIGYNLNHKDGVPGSHNDTGRMTWDGSNSYYYITVNDL